MSKKKKKSKKAKNIVTPKLENMVQVICPDCGMATIVNPETKQTPYCYACGRPLFLPQKKKKKKNDDF